MAHETIEAMNAVVTLDVALPGIVWPWLVTMNMWAKSIGTGVLFLGYFMFRYYGNENSVKEMKLPIAILSFTFLSMFLLFTLADLHQPFRMWHIFFYPHWTSPITVGAVIASVLMGLVSMLVVAAYLKRDDIFEKAWMPTLILAIPVTLYTATLMGMSTARELWQVPVELVQMMLAALLSGAATMLLFGHKFSFEVNRMLAIVLGASAAAGFTIYMGEYVFGPFKAEEVAATLAYIKGDGEYTAMFWIGQVIAFVIPMVLTYLGVTNKNRILLLPAAISALVGLWIVKHVWLMIPQLLPMS
ncbi:MAG: polysulfide reductase [Sulfuricurvum sp. PC08-66]|nr:MAG: polysulfide reductase [Sulfuricurvum sp. PC08-66]